MFRWAALFLIVATTLSIHADPPAGRPLYVAVGHHGMRLSSSDGVTWSKPQLGKDGQIYRAVRFGNGRFVAVGSYGGDNIFAATQDGETWKTATKEAKYVHYVRGLAFASGIFFGLGGDPGSVGDSRPFLLKSTDGLVWSEPDKVPGKFILRRMTHGKDLFVAVGDRGRRSASPDALVWKDAPETKAIDTCVDIAFGNGVFVGVGLHGLRMTSTDGLAWTHRQLGEEGEHLNAALWAQDKFVAVGMGATYFSHDGKTWQRQENKNAPHNVAYGNGLFIGSSWKGRILTSKDAITWTQTHQAEHHIEAIAFGSP